MSYNRYLTFFSAVYFAAPGKWTVRALSHYGTGDVSVAAERGITQVAVTVAE